MADETKMVNEDFADAQAVDITGDEVSEVAQLSQKILALEEEKQELVHATKVLNDEIDKMKESVKLTVSEKEDLKREIEKLGSENRSLHAVAARAAELEAEVSRLHQDLASAMSDVQELNSEASGWKSKAENLEKAERTKSAELDAIKKERDLLIGKLTNSEVKEIEKEEQIKDLESKVAEKKALEKSVADARGLEKELLEKIEFLESKLKAVGDITTGLPNGKTDTVEDIASAEGRNKACVGGFKLDLPLIAISTVGAVGVAGIMCYLHATKKE